jgi:hypothetical protein
VATAAIRTTVVSVTMTAAVPAPVAAIMSTAVAVVITLTPTWRWDAGRGIWWCRARRPGALRWRH